MAGTLSTVPDFSDQDELFYYFIQNMKMSFIVHIKFHLICKSNVLLISVVWRGVSLSGEAVR